MQIYQYDMGDNMNDLLNNHTIMLEKLLRDIPGNANLDLQELYEKYKFTYLFKMHMLKNKSDNEAINQLSIYDTMYEKNILYHLHKALFWEGRNNKQLSQNEYIASLQCIYAPQEYILKKLGKINKLLSSILYVKLYIITIYMISHNIFINLQPKYKKLGLIYEMINFVKKIKLFQKIKILSIKVSTFIEKGIYTLLTKGAYKKILIEPITVFSSSFLFTRNSIDENDIDYDIYIPIPVWGEEYCRNFLEFYLPTHFAHGNIEDLSKHYKICYIFYTNSFLAPMFNTSEIIKRLKSFAEVKLIFIDRLLLISNNHYYIMNSCHSDFIRRMHGKAGNVLWLLSDHILSENFFSSLIKFFNRKIFVYCLGLRVNQEKIINECANIKLECYKLTDMILHGWAHPSNAWLYVNGNMSSACPSILMWNTDSKNCPTIAHAMHLHPILSPIPKDNILICQSIDGDLLSQQNSIFELNIVQTSKNFILCSGTKEHALDNWNIQKKFEYDDIINHMHNYANIFHRAFLLYKIYFYLDEIPTIDHKLSNEYIYKLLCYEYESQ